MTLGNEILHEYSSPHFNEKLETLAVVFLYQIGTDIEDFKCSWLVVKALERSNEEQLKILYVRK